MTCIVGLVDNGEVYMGGDSAGVAGLSITIRNDEKVFTNGPFIIGFTSSFRMGQLLRFKFAPPKQTNDISDYEFMVTDFIDAVRKCFAMNGFGNLQDRSHNVGGSFLVGYNGVLYSVDSDFQVGIPTKGYDAVGCGADLALGALFVSEGMLSPTERVQRALEAAEAFSGGVSAPFVCLTSKEDINDKKVKSTDVKKRAPRNDRPTKSSKKKVTKQEVPKTVKRPVKKTTATKKTLQNKK